MYRFGHYYIGTSNNWKRLHGFPMIHGKRYPHERKCGSKKERIKYHTMKKAGCEDWLICKHAPGYFKWAYGDRRRKK